uniref:Uncharacterized protein n=1 Tax=Romanomermis culicivorax TaxID=13658 RepID=A0A915IQM7_ROMCU
MSPVKNQTTRNEHLKKSDLRKTLDEDRQEWIPEFVLNACISNTQAYPINYLINVLKPDNAYPTN